MRLRGSRRPSNSSRDQRHFPGQAVVRAFSSVHLGRSIRYVDARIDSGLRGPTRSVERDLALVLVQPGVERLESGVELTHQVEVPDAGEVFGRVRIELVHVGDFQGAGLPGRPHLVVGERSVDDLPDRTSLR